jgi:hypothetical protein
MRIRLNFPTGGLDSTPFAGQTPPRLFLFSQIESWKTGRGLIF